MTKISLVQTMCFLVCGTSSPLALAQAGLQTSPPEIIVTASKGEQHLQTAPIGATVITRTQMESAGVLDANEAIRNIGAIAAKTDLDGGREWRLDIRGFGDTASSNVVVLVDGVRISENESTAARLSALSSDLIERIEIVRGGSSVLWGEGATAGVINIITRKDAKLGVSGQVGVGVSSFIGRDGNANLRVGLPFAKSTFDLALNSRSSSGYRQNSRSTQDVASVGFHVQEGNWQARLRLHSESSGARLPGPLNQSQFLQNPRQADVGQLSNWMGLKQTRLSTGVDYRVGNWAVHVDAGLQDRTKQSSWGGVVNRETSLTQVTPRLVYTDSVGLAATTLTMGLDTQQWRYADQGNRRAQQTNRAWFVMNDWLLPSQTRVVAGYRSEHIDKSVEGAIGADALPQLANRLTATELSVNQSLSQGLDIYARAARSYRLANFDEYIYTDLTKQLRPQISRDTEIGLKYRDSHHVFAVRYFQQRTVDEIAYAPFSVPPFGANINLDPTLRQGIEVQESWRLSPLVTLSLAVQRLQAVFADGVYEGRHVPLASPKTATVRAVYQMNANSSFDTAWRLVSSAYPGSDFSNACLQKTPSARLFDAMYRYVEPDFEVSLGVFNLTNVQSYTHNYQCVVSPTTGSIYPDVGRSLRAAVKYSF